MKTPQRAIALFIGLEAIIVALFTTLIALDSGGLSQNVPYALVLMLSPAILGLLIGHFVLRDLKSFGWRLGKPRFLAIAYFTPLLYITIPFALLVALGIVQLDAATLKAFGPIEWLQTFLVNILILCVLVAGEEIGWRGFLLPQLCKIMSFAKASFLVGLVWIAVHVPIFIFADYNAGDTPLWFRLICFTVLAFGANMAINWLRMASASVWTAILFHATHNSYLQDISPLFQKSVAASYWLSEAGLGLAIAGIFVGLVFWQMSKNNTFTQPQKT